MGFVGCVFAPGIRVLAPDLVVEQRSRPFVAAVSLEAVRIRCHRPVCGLVLDERAVLQAGKSGADRTLVEFGLGGDFRGLERPVIVCREERENLLRYRQVREFVFARVLEGLPIDGDRYQFIRPFVVRTLVVKSM
jgi:hypothetical protein